MASLITIRLETIENTTIKVVGGDGKTIKMLSFLRSAFPVVKQSYKSGNEYFADFNLARPGLYVIISDDGRTIYIGQSDNVAERLNTHYSNQDKKEYWVNTMTFTTDGSNSLNISQIKFIESELIRIAQKAAKVKVEDEDRVLNIKNKQKANIPNINPNDRVIAVNFLADILSLTKALGINYFEEKKLDIVWQRLSEKEVFFLQNSYADAKMILDGDRIVVLKGSKARLDTTPSCHEFLKTKRSLLIESGQLKEEDGILITQEDIVFDSSSGAAGVINGAATNGRISWKNKEGKTLKDLGL